MTGPMLLLFGLAVSAAIVAPEARAERVARAEFREQRDAILLGLAEGQRYSEITSEQRETVLAALDRIQEAIGTAERVDALSPAARVAIYNDQQRINTVLTAAEDASREVCRHHRTVYSRLKTSECHTVAEWERRHKHSVAVARVFRLRSAW